MSIALYIVLGLFAGISAGFFGIGGGLVLIPAMTMILGMTQHQAQGTSLAVLIPPVGIFAAWKYYQNGHVNLPVAVFICLGFVFGGFFGAQFAQGISDHTMKKAFGVFLLLVSVKMIAGK